MANVADILKKKGGTVHTVHPDATIMEATRIMNDNRIGALVVVAGGRVAGMFTERDVLTRVVAAGRDPRAVTVADAMTTPVAYCTPDTSIDECRNIVTEKRIRHLPVMDGDDIVGLVTSGDMLAFDLVKSEQTIHFLESYIQS